MSFDVDRIVDDLREALALLSRIDLWPPWDAAQQVVDAVASLLRIAALAPDPAPEDIAPVRAAWRRIGERWQTASDDIERASGRLAAPTVWEGAAGTACRASTDALAGRADTLVPACTTIEQALVELEPAMRAARARHDAAYERLGRHLTIQWTDLDPGALVDKLRAIIEDAAAAGAELVGAYEDAGQALHACAATLDEAFDDVDLPVRLAPGVSAVDQTNASGHGLGDNDSGPLRGSTAQRAADRLAAMSPADRAAVQALLDAADNDLAKAWILAAVASGADLATLRNYAARVSSMSRDELTRLDPAANPGIFRQPDATTCGSASLLYARMLNDPAFAMMILTGYDPRTGQQLGDPGPFPGDRNPVAGSPAHNRFAWAAQAMHDQTNGLTDHDGDFNGWWPEQAGTSPGSAARQMGGGPGASGVPGSDYDVNYIAPSNLGSSYDQLVSQANAGQAVPLYIGGVSTQGSSGFHVILVTGTQGDNLLVYEPESGQTYTVTRAQFTGEQLPQELGWQTPFAMVTSR